MKKKYGVIRNLSKQEFAQLVANSKTISSILRSFGLTNNTGNHRTVWARIKREGLDGSHFPKQGMKGVAKTKEHRLKLGLSKIAKHGVTLEAYEKAVVEGKRWCTSHKDFLPLKNFSKLAHCCKVCAHEHNLRRIYKLPVGWYSKQLVLQHDLCAICNSTPSKGGNFYVDHDHGCCPNERSCGKCVRGLICNRCNVLLGHIEKNMGLTQKALEYLIRYKENNA